MLYLLILIILFSFGYFMTKFLVKFCLDNGFYKKITKRDIHSQNVSFLGGVSIFIVFTLSISTLLISDIININNDLDILSVIFFAFLFFIFGLYDDFHEISYRSKFLFQIIIFLILIFFFEIGIESFYGIFDIYNLSYFFEILFTLIVCVFIINSYNLSDGVDSLASSLAIFILSSFSYIFFINDFFLDFAIAMSVVFSLIIFLFFNSPPAKIFMGNSGSMFIGFIISYFAVKACNLPIDSNGTQNPVLILCILAYPSIDTFRVFLIRIKNGKSPFIADKNHLHHFILRKNFSHGFASFLAIFYSLVLTVICFILRFDTTLSFIVLISLAILFIYLPFTKFIYFFLNKLLSVFK